MAPARAQGPGRNASPGEDGEGLEEALQQKRTGQAAADVEDERRAGAEAAAWIEASWLTWAVRPAMALSRSDRLELEFFSSSSTTSFTASLASVSRSLARSRMSSTKSLVSSTMSSMKRVKVFLRLDMKVPFARPVPSHHVRSVDYASRN